MKDENEWMKNTLFQDLTNEHEKSFKINFLISMFFFFFVALFWLNILTRGHTKSQPDTRNTQRQTVTWAMCARAQRQVTLHKEPWTWVRAHHKDSESTFHRNHVLNACEDKEISHSASLPRTPFAFERAFGLAFASVFCFRFSFALRTSLCDKPIFEHRKCVISTAAALSTISVSSAKQVPKVQIRKKKSGPLSTISVSSASHLPEVQTRKNEKCDPLSTIFVSSAWHLPEVQTRKKEKCEPVSTISVSSAWHLPEVQTRKKKRKARSTLHNFCQLGLAPERFSDPEKKSAIHSPQFRSTRPGTCPRFRQEKKKVRSTLHNVCRLGQAPAQGSDPKKKVRSTLHNFCQLGLAPARGSDPKKRKVRSTLHNFCQLGLAPARGPESKKRKGAIHSPQFLSARPSTCPRFRSKKKGTIHSPQFLSTPPSTCPMFRPEKKGDPLSTISVSSAWHLPEVQTRKNGKCDPLSTISVSSAWHLPEVQTRKKKCDPLSTISVSSPGTCPRFRPEKKARSTLHKLLSARPSTCPRFRPGK